MVKTQKYYKYSESKPSYDNRPGNAPARINKCYTCGEEEHYARDKSCPKYKERKNIRREQENRGKMKTSNLVEEDDVNEGEVFDVAMTRLDSGRDDSWYFDSGASKHVTWDACNFDMFEKTIGG